MAVSPKKVAWEISTFQVVNKGTHKEPLFLFYNPRRSQLRTICDISLLVAPEWFVPFGWEMDEVFWIASSILYKCIPTKMLFSWKLLPWISVKNSHAPWKNQQLEVRSSRNPLLLSPRSPLFMGAIFLFCFRRCFFWHIEAGSLRFFPHLKTTKKTSPFFFLKIPWNKNQQKSRHPPAQPIHLYHPSALRIAWIEIYGTVQVIPSVQVKRLFWNPIHLRANHASYTVHGIPGGSKIPQRHIVCLDIVDERGGFNDLLQNIGRRVNKKVG